MKTTHFQYRRWWTIETTPAQFGGLVEGLNGLFATDDGLQLLFAQWGIGRPFHVYGLPVVQGSTSPVVVRYPGDGEIDLAYRDPRYGWIDAIVRLDGKTDLVFVYNFSTSTLPIDARLLLWQWLFSWMDDAGCSLQNIDAEFTPAMIGDAERTPVGDQGGETTEEKRLRYLWPDESLSYDDLADKLGYTESWVSRRKKKLGLPDRTKGRKPGR